MKFVELPLHGAFAIEIERLEDSRGFFARTFCEEEFQKNGLVSRFVQSSLSYNVRRGTVRGLHFQQSPWSETKLVRCTSGSVLDVIVDLRAGSPTYLQSTAVELSAGRRTAIYIPKDFAHGFQTLTDDAELLYQIDTSFVASAAKGIRWNDPAIGITWPLPISVIAEKDTRFPDWTK